MPRGRPPGGLLARWRGKAGLRSRPRVPASCDKYAPHANGPVRYQPECALLAHPAAPQARCSARCRRCALMRPPTQRRWRCSRCWPPSPCRCAALRCAVLAWCLGGSPVLRWRCLWLAPVPHGTERSVLNAALCLSAPGSPSFPALSTEPPNRPPAHPPTLLSHPPTLRTRDTSAPARRPMPRSGATLRWQSPTTPTSPPPSGAPRLGDIPRPLGCGAALLACMLLRCSGRRACSCPAPSAVAPA